MLSIYVTGSHSDGHNQQRSKKPPSYFFTENPVNHHILHLLWTATIGSNNSHNQQWSKNHCYISFTETLETPLSFFILFILSYPLNETISFSVLPFLTLAHISSSLSGISFYSFYSLITFNNLQSPQHL